MTLLTPITQDGALTLYRCKCGTEKQIRTSCVNSGRIKSCGCLRRETMKENRKGKVLSDSKVQQVLKYLEVPDIQTSLIAHVMGIHQVTVSKIKRKYFKTVRIDYIESLENQVQALQNALNALKKI